MEIAKCSQTSHGTSPQQYAYVQACLCENDVFMCFHVITLIAHGRHGVSDRLFNNLFNTNSDNDAGYERPCPIYVCPYETALPNIFKMQPKFIGFQKWFNYTIPSAKETSGFPFTNIVLPTLLTVIPAWLSNSIYHKVWDEITYPFPNVNGATVAVWE